MPLDDSSTWSTSMCALYELILFGGILSQPWMNLFFGAPTSAY
jgi:hypothetical protein